MYTGFGEMFTKYPHAIVITRKIFITFHKTMKLYNVFFPYISNNLSIIFHKFVEWSLLITLGPLFKLVEIFVILLAKTVISF
jgi:hypothetical protein